MRFLLSILLTAFLSFLAGIFLPWWSIAVIAFLVAIVFRLHPGKGFISGFISIFLLWGLLALWIDIKNQGVLSSKIAVVFPLGGSSILLILATALTGALVGGFAAMAGSAMLPSGNKVRRTY